MTRIMKDGLFAWRMPEKGKICKIAIKNFQKAVDKCAPV